MTLEREQAAEIENLTQDVLFSNLLVEEAAEKVTASEVHGSRFTVPGSRFRVLDFGPLIEPMNR
jgi:hypothetical protein